MTGRNRVAAALFAILLGGFGVHKFYLGKIGQGVLYLVFCWTFLPAVIGFIEGIIYLTMTDAAFEAKYGFGIQAMADAQPTTVKCWNCGTRNSAGEDFCKNCSHALDRPAAPKAAISDTKLCPFCAETIKAAAIKCRYCGSDLTANKQQTA